jgi:hypothetical protein
MPDPKRLLQTLKRAALAFDATPGRRGRLVWLQEVEEVLVVGDLHGNIENFRQILDLAQLTLNPRRHMVFQELIHGPGRYPDGTDKSHQLIDLLAALKCQFPRQVHFLLGNHELAQWQGHAIMKADLELNHLFQKGVDSAYGADGAAIYDAYLSLFARSPLALRTPNRVFLSHSLPSARRQEGFDSSILEVDEPANEHYQWGGGIHALLWGRDYRAETVAEFLRKVDADLVITGHLPCSNGYDVPNDRQLVLDCLGTPGGYCLFPADRPISQRELIDCVKVL